MSPKTEFLLIRHGQTDWNILKRLQGHSDIPLNETGLAQAQTLAQTLASEKLDAIYSSDLQRASVTAETIAKSHGLIVTKTQRLRERCYGICEGMKGDEIKEKFPESHRAWYAADPDHFFPDGERKTESPRQFYHRVIDILNDIAKRHQNERVAIITHFGVIENAFRLSQKIPLGERCRMPVLNTSINRFLLQDGQLSLLAWGESSHLEEGKQKVDYYKHF